MIGSRFDKYIIQEELGQGGMGRVYRAFHTGLNADVVLKMISRRLIEENPKFGQLFAQEAQTIAQLNHYAIVPVYDYGEYQGQPYIVMRLMAGGDLAVRMESQPHFSLHEASSIVQRVAAALDKAHSQQIVHRDIKPGNIMFDEDDLAYLGDFGIAKQTRDTSAVTTIGTWPYMAPEQWDGGSADSRTDIYQLGCTLYQMLTGELPYNASNAAGWMYQHTESPVPSVTAIRPDLPRSIDGILNKALAKSPPARYTSAGALAQALMRVMKQAAAPDTAILSDNDNQNMFPKRPNMPNNRLQMETAAPKRSWLWPLVGFFVGLGVIGAFALGSFLNNDNNSGNNDPTPTSEVVNTSSDPTEFAVAVTDEPTTEIVPTDTAVPLVPIDEQPTVDPESPETERVSPIDSMVQLFVPAGSFLMGSTPEEATAAFNRACQQAGQNAPLCSRDIYDAELPLHTVELDAYWIDQTEITNSMYDLCVADGDCTEPTSDLRSEMNVSIADYLSAAEFENHPVIGVDWEQARAYCAWAGRQLPTEAQWERAARGNDGDRIYPFGDDISCDVANFAPPNAETCVGRPVAVDELVAGISPFGALNMTGNVWEWVEDWYDPAFYQNSPAANPTGPIVPPTGQPASKIVRGSAWNALDVAVRAVNRGRVPTDSIDDNLGIRCAELD